MKPPYDTSLPDRYWSKVDEPNSNGCWLWNAGKLVSGYGIYSVKHKNKPATHYSYADIHGSVPEGKFMLHHCDVRACVNPFHLYAGTRQDNVDDMYRRNRENNIKGTAVPNSKLTEEIVREMRHMRSEYGATFVDIADYFGVSKSTASHAITGINWAWVK